MPCSRISATTFDVRPEACGNHPVIGTRQSPAQHVSISRFVTTCLIPQAGTDSVALQTYSTRGMRRILN